MVNQLMTKQVEVALLLAAVRRRQRQAVESRVVGTGLSSQQFWVLEAIFARGTCTLGEILAVLPMDQPTASRVMAALQKRKLVKMEVDATDRRRRRLELTRQGERMARECADVAKKVRTAIVAGFSQGELGTLSSFLARLVGNLDRMDGVSPSVGGKGLAKTRGSDT